MISRERSERRGEAGGRAETRIARAPGKLVLSGAYAVLEGAPALVAAVDRYAIADASRPPDLVTPEVQAAIDAGALPRAPWFDASSLRTAAEGGATRKLGLGSSAAILVASLAAFAAPRAASAGELRAAVLEPALAAHRRAQGGGSGIDVAASVHGGVLACTLSPTPSGPLAISAHQLPAGLLASVLVAESSASTRDLVARVRALRDRDRSTFDRLIAQAAAGAVAAVEAADAASFTAALDAQWVALAELGDLAGAPIVTRPVAELRRAAAAEGLVAGPSGAGGGDVVLVWGAQAPSPDLLSRAAELGLHPLAIRLGAEGVHLWTT